LGKNKGGGKETVHVDKLGVKCRDAARVCVCVCVCVYVCARACACACVCIVFVSEVKQVAVGEGFRV
jgi:hypothetical protein